ncbi:putative CRM domain-containing protein, chloroplastic [Sesamum alatum]|uniref:CRM domain-containing protein, chloroplastic n=1 Tax=Sesamum alatum TaxID=300844 RepID=A0AAE2D007_9LAMI|nr:putative CRM domain-containing protein, chloroplastic [Sesamum alatum]
MAARNLACKCLYLKRLSANYVPFAPFLSQSHFIFQIPSYLHICKIVGGGVPAVVGKCSHYDMGVQRCNLGGVFWIHSGRVWRNVEPVVEQIGKSDGSGEVQVKTRKKPKGKRAVVRWLKFFRWKKKKESERMTTEEKILYKLRKARRKEERLLEALNKIEPKESSETTHDPEILTPEEHFYFLKMGEKCKNYVPVGRRGIYQGVILNMHLHWKKHQTLKVIVKTFSPEEVKDIASELARLSGGIVLDIQDHDTIIMYRGKNYSQPPTEIMSPRSTLSRKKALDKSKYRDALRAVRKYIPRLEQDLELLQAQNERKISMSEEKQPTDACDVDPGNDSNQHFEGSDRLKELLAKTDVNDDDSDMDSDIVSDSEALSDIFETDSDTENEEKAEKPLYLDAFEKIPMNSDEEQENFEEHLRQISADSRKEKSSDKDPELADLDEVDRMVLRAASLLKKRRR